MDNIEDTQPVILTKKPTWRFWLVWIVVFIVSIGLLTTIGVWYGYQSGIRDGEHNRAIAAARAVQEQFDLGLRDLNAGRFDLARQRFEYVLATDPNYPGAAEQLSEALSVLYATSTPSPIPPTATLTPTRDISPIEDIFNRAQQSFEQEDWERTIDEIIALRRQDPLYRVVDVDNLLYQALMNRGIDKIRKSISLEGGIYDLSLAERFGPLSSSAYNWRNLARLYLIGSSFWEVYPEQAVYYFGMVASAGPYLRDASGWTARERYRASLIHYGKQLESRGEWCAAQEQYDLALSIRNEAGLVATASEISIQCYRITVTPDTQTPTAPFTPTVTLTGTQVGSIQSLTPTPSPTLIVTSQPTSTHTQMPAATPTYTPTPSQTPAPTEGGTPNAIPASMPAH